MILKNRLFLVYLFVCFSVFPQQKEYKTTDFITRQGNFLCNKNKKADFCKSVYFFNKREFDSCYIYVGKALSNSVDTDERNFLYYIYGYSASKKGFYKKALNNLSLISDENYKQKKTSISGHILLKNKRYEEAIKKFQIWILGDTIVKNNAERRFVYQNLGISHIHTKEYIKAKEYFSKVQKLIGKDTISLMKFKTNIANIYYNQYLDDKAIPLFKEAYKLANIYSDLELKQNTAKNMAVVEKNRKRYKESIKYYEEYNRWKDSIWNRDKIWELTEKDKQLAVAQKQQEIAVQDEQIKRQKVVQNGLLLGALGLLVFIGGLGYFYRRLKKQKQLITEQKEALDVANKTKNYLFSVVSHDLRSPINTIKRQHKKLAKHIANNDLPAIKEANQQAISVTDSTSHLLNNVLQWSLEQSNQLNFSQEEYALQPIIEHILFDYEELAESNDISVFTNFEDDIVVKTDKESLKIVLRNLIDNSVKYMNGAGSIAISTATQNNQARIEIKDSGIGISEEKLQKINALKDLSVDKIDRSKGVGLGLILCQTLIKKNNGTLFFESEEGKSTTAVVLLPLV